MRPIARRSVDAVAALIVYLGVYLFMNFGAFAIVAFVRNARGSESIADYAGMVRRSPAVAVAMAVILFSLVGLPPLAGFSAKFAAFAALLDAKMYPLLIIGGLNTVVSLFYYLRVVKVMMLEARARRAAGPGHPPVLDCGRLCRRLGRHDVPDIRALGRLVDDRPGGRLSPGELERGIVNKTLESPLVASVLNRLLRTLSRSLALYVEEVRPWGLAGHEPLWTAIERLAADSRMYSQRVAEAIIEHGGQPHPGPYPLEFAALNDVGLEFFLRADHRPSQTRPEDDRPVVRRVGSCPCRSARWPKRPTAISRGHSELLEKRGGGIVGPFCRKGPMCVSLQETCAV